MSHDKTKDMLNTNIQWKRWKITNWLADCKIMRHHSRRINTIMKIVILIGVHRQSEVLQQVRLCYVWFMLYSVFIDYLCMCSSVWFVNHTVWQSGCQFRSRHISQTWYKIEHKLFKNIVFLPKAAQWNEMLLEHQTKYYMSFFYFQEALPFGRPHYRLNLVFCKIFRQ